MSDDEFGWDLEKAWILGRYNAILAQKTAVGKAMTGSDWKRLRQDTAKALGLEQSVIGWILTEMRKAGAFG